MSKLALFGFYAGAAFITGLVLVFSTDDGTVLLSHWSKFWFPLWVVFCIVAIISCFLPSKFSYIGPGVVFLAIIFIYGMTIRDSQKIKNDPANIPVNGFVNDVNNFKCGSNYYFTVDPKNTLSSHYIGKSNFNDKNIDEVVGDIVGNLIILKKGALPGGNQNTSLSECKNSDGKSLKDLFTIS